MCACKSEKNSIYMGSAAHQDHAASTLPREPVRSKGDSSPLNSKKQSKYPEMGSTWTIGDFWCLVQSQHSSGTCETSSPLPERVISSKYW